MDTTVTKTNPLGTERIGKLVLTFAVPSIISMVVNALYNIVDQIFIGQGVGYLGNGATNVVMPMTVIAIALSLLIGDGAAAYLSLKLGEGDENQQPEAWGVPYRSWRLWGLFSASCFICCWSLCVYYLERQKISCLMPWIMDVSFRMEFCFLPLIPVWRV